MSPEENKQVLRRVFDEALTKNQLDVIDELYSDDYEFESVAVAGVDPNSQGREGFKKRVTAVRSSFEDPQFVIDDIAAENDLVATYFSLNGKHIADFAGFAPTNRPVSLRGIHFSRFVDGKIKKTWAGFANVVEALSA